MILNYSIWLLFKLVIIQYNMFIDTRGVPHKIAVSVLYWNDSIRGTDPVGKGPTGR